MDDGEMAAQTFDNLEHVGGEKNRGAARDHALKHRFERPGSDRVNTLERLVEKKDFGAVDHGCGESQFFLHAVRVVGDELFRLVGEMHEIEELGGSLRCGLAVEAVYASNKIQILGAGETAEEGHAFGHDSNLALHLERMQIGRA